jgi:hypothetical protein
MSKKRKTIPARFFLGNPYTKYNIKLYLEKISNKKISVLDFCDVQNAHDKFILYDSNINLSYSKSWNDIKNGNFVKKMEYPNYISPTTGKKCHVSPRRKIILKYIDKCSQL